LIGHGYVHAAVDDHSRLAYAEIHADETSQTATGFLVGAQAWFASRGVLVQRVLTDNGGCYRSHAWRQACQQLGIAHKRTRPYRPQTNGKVERFNRTAPCWRLGLPAAVRQRAGPPGRLRALAALA
jgi:transposase InsO family protein